MAVLRVALTAAVWAWAAAAVSAQPAFLPTSKPVSLVVTIAPGGSMDALARIYAERLGNILRRNVVVENRTGAGAAIGTDYVARSAPDGHTVLLMDTSTVLQNLFKKDVSFDVLRDFSPIAKAAGIQLALFAHPSLPAANAAELVAYARGNPGKLSAGFGGIGTPHHLAGALLNMRADVNITLVPYRGSAAMVTDLLGGQIPLIWSTPIAVLPHVREGRIKGIAVASSNRVALMPDIETFAERDLAEVKVDMWMGFAAPRGTPTAFVEAFSKAVAQISAAPEVRERLKAIGFSVDYDDADGLRSLIAREHAGYKAIIERAGLAAN